MADRNNTSDDLGGIDISSQSLETKNISNNTHLGTVSLIEKVDKQNDGHINVSITLNELYNGCVKKVAIKSGDAIEINIDPRNISSFNFVENGTHFHITYDVQCDSGYSVNGKDIIYTFQRDDIPENFMFFNGESFSVQLHGNRQVIKGYGFTDSSSTGDLILQVESVNQNKPRYMGEIKCNLLQYINGFDVLFKYTRNVNFQMVEESRIIQVRPSKERVVVLEKAGDEDENTPPCDFHFDINIVDIGTATLNVPEKRIEVSVKTPKGTMVKTPFRKQICCNKQQIQQQHNGWTFICNVTFVPSENDMNTTKQKLIEHINEVSGYINRLNDMKKKINNSRDAQ
ncbi:hypothetical protein QTN25_001760 [Entamoeba marina]